MGSKIARLTREEIRALPVTVDLPTAGRAFGMGRTKSYDLARADKFPCPVLPLGARFVVTKTALLHALGLEPAETAEAAEPGRTAA